MPRVRRTVRNFPRKMMPIRITAWRGVNWDTLKLALTQFTVMVNCGDILPGKRAYPVTRGAKRKQAWDFRFQNAKIREMPNSPN
jgi:hypothetical protein